MDIKLNKVQRISREEMLDIKQKAQLCTDILIQEEYSMLKDKSVLKEIIFDNFNYLAGSLFFEKTNKHKSTNYIYILSCWVNEISKLNIGYDDFVEKLNHILGLSKECPYVIKDAFDYIKSNKSLSELTYKSDKIYKYNTGQIDIRDLISEPSMSEIDSLKQEICLAINDYGSNHVSLLKSDNEEYNLMYHSLHNSFGINDEPYLLKGISQHEIENLCEAYDIDYGLE